MKLLFGLLACCALLPAAFDPHSWATRRLVKPISVPFGKVVITPSLYEDSQAQLRDLRLMREGTEVRYVLKTLAASREEQTLPAVLMDKAAIPGVGVQLILDVGQSSPHDQVTIYTDRINFNQRVRIETSNDRHNWGVVRRDGIIFDVSSADHHASGLSISYPSSTADFVRVTIEGWTDPAGLRSASVSFVHEVAARRDLVADLRPSVKENREEHLTILDFDLGFGRPYDRIEFEVGPGLFSRDATISTSSDGKTWSGAGFGTIRRSSTEERLDVEIAERWQRYVQVRIRNLDNAPLLITSARFRALRRELIFPAKQGDLYWLYSGNPVAEQPRYDLENILPASTGAVEASVGETKRNPDYRPPKSPATDRLTWLLTALLFLLVPVMGAIAFKMLQQVNRAR